MLNHQLENLLKIAKQRGATHAEVYQVTSQSHPLFFEGNRLKQVESCQSRGTALRLWLDARPGLAVAYGNLEPQLLVDKAIALSQLNQPEIIELAPPRTEIHSSNQLKITRENLVELGDRAITQLREEYPELICSAELEWEKETTTLINSQGLHCQYSESSLSCFLGAELVRGEDFLGVYHEEYSQTELDLQGAIEQILLRLDWAKQNVPPPVGKMPVLFTANAANLLWDTVSVAVNGKTVVENSSPWSDRQGELIVSPLLNLTQQPELQPYACPFDDEGTPTQTLNLIANGVLNQFYSGRTIARELGIQSTGNGFRPSLDSYPTPSLVNLIVTPGTNTLAELISQLERGIIVDRILGGGADISGDFSVNVDLGYGVHQGKVIGRVKDTAIAGNVYQLLQQVVALGNDRCWQDSCYTPSLIVEGLSVVG